MNNNMKEIPDALWIRFCVLCNRRCPVGLDGRMHKNRKICPECFYNSNNREQNTGPGDWLARTTWHYLKQAHPGEYQDRLNGYLQQQRELSARVDVPRIYEVPVVADVILVSEEEEDNMSRTDTP